MRVLLLAAALMLAGCVLPEREALTPEPQAPPRSPEGYGNEGTEDDMPTPAPRPSPANRALAFERIEPCTPRGPEGSGAMAREETNQVVINASAWEGTWHGLCQEPDVPAVDFTQQHVIVTTWGEKTSGGYVLRIVNVTQQGTLYIAWVERVAPGPDCVTAAVMTYPLDFVRTERVFEVDFEFLDRTQDC